jgi:anti-sigma factor RsiW
MEALEDYVGGALEASQAEAVRAHLDSCAECRDAVSEANTAGDLLREAYEPARVPAGAFWTRLRAELREEEARAAAGGEFWGSLERLAWRLSFGAAALAMLLVGIVIGSQFPVPPVDEAQTETREVFPEPVRQPVDRNEVLLELSSARTGNGSEGQR